MKQWFIGLAVACALGTAQARGAGSSVTGVVTRVADGDTFWLRVQGTAAEQIGKPIKVRLLGIDAPEQCQAWGPQAKAALESRVLNRRVTLRVRTTDDYRRSLATLELGGEDIGAWMVSRGHAWSTRFHRSLGAYATQERAARAARRGLFALNDPVEPGAFRKAHGPCL
jgi:micrococcal nuclease